MPSSLYKMSNVLQRSSSDSSSDAVLDSSAVGPDTNFYTKKGSFLLKM